MNIERIVSDIARSGNEKKFKEYVDSISKESFQAQKSICQNIFKQFDSEIEKESQNQTFLRILIAIPVELALLHQTEQINPQTENFIEFLSSHFLARSNGTHESLRLATMIFYSHVKNQPQWKRQRILERFGENILNTIFYIYSNEKSKSSAAFYFLSENLESFLSLSPELAAMTNSFLQTYMFKKPIYFITFIHQYKNYLLEKQNHGNFFPIHLSFLIRQSFELEHKDLSLHLSKILIEYVHSFESRAGYIENTFQDLAKIMLQSKTLTTKEVGTFIQNELKNKRTISFKSLLKHLNWKHDKKFFSILKKKLNTESISAFQKILLLQTKA